MLNVQGTYLERQVGQAEEFVEESQAKAVAHRGLGVTHVVVVAV